MLDNMLKNSREQANLETPIIDNTIIVNKKKRATTIRNKEQHISTNVNNSKQIKKPEDKIIKSVTDVDSSQQLSPNVNNLINEIINGTSSVLPKDVQRKTFYLKPEILKMFKYIKRKKRIGESEFINFALEKVFYEEFGKNWHELG
jgi:hypothetical protein